MAEPINDLCVCCSGKLFVKCCDQFLNKRLIPKTPVQLMRSRYSAYALGGYGDYLLATWLPSMTQGLNSAELSLRSVEWRGLQIVNKEQKGDKGVVEFKALYLGGSDQELVQYEKSVFQRINGHWFYVGGEVS